MGTKKPSREEVLAWMIETGKGAHLASQHFNVPLGTVKSWAQRTRTASARDRTHPPSSSTGAERGGSNTHAPAAPGKPSTGELAATRDDIDDLERDTVEAIRLRLKHLSHQDSVGTKGERDTAIATGILLDKLEKLAAVRRLARGPDADDEAAVDADGVLDAFGMKPPKG